MSSRFFNGSHCIHVYIIIIYIYIYTHAYCSEAKPRAEHVLTHCWWHAATLKLEKNVCVHVCTCVCMHACVRVPVSLSHCFCLSSSRSQFCVYRSLSLSLSIFTYHTCIYYIYIHINDTYTYIHVYVRSWDSFYQPSTVVAKLTSAKWGTVIETSYRGNTSVTQPSLPVCSIGQNHILYYAIASVCISNRHLTVQARKPRALGLRKI